MPRSLLSGFALEDPEDPRERASSFACSLTAIFFSISAASFRTVPTGSAGPSVGTVGSTVGSVGLASRIDGNMPCLMASNDHLAAMYPKDATSTRARY